ncbi:MAG: hypothetical protein JRI68_02315 [Deltaproteobacteria bacterium]|nr:hypothetical protein [Deltaproteobacteria bacterium]
MVGRYGGWAARALASAAFVVVGCSVVNEYQEVPACATDAACDDGNPCTEATCSAEGTCSISAVPDGDSPEQTAHDCQTLRCEGGHQVAVSDPSDKPVDEPCLRYLCDAMSLSPEPSEVGAPCELNGIPGTCSNSGDCEIECDDDGDCEDDNPCTVDSCNVTAGKCVYEPHNNVLAPDSSQEDGDCQQLMCLEGVEAPVIDDTDLPSDDNDCTEDLCNQGVPSNLAEPANTACTVPNDPPKTLCDGQGNCVECNGPSQCDHLPSDTFCGTRTCIAGVCGQDCMGTNTLTPGQQLGDCKSVVCDGACGTTEIANPQDPPIDNNDCTQDICTGMTPSNPNEPPNTVCGSQGTLYCNGSGVCVGCTSSSQCLVDVFCRDHFCNGQQQCDFNDTANNTPLPSQDQTTGDCQELQCNGIGGVKSASISDPFNDGNDCTIDTCVSGNPVHPARALNYSCNDNGGTYCDGNGTCVECNDVSQCPAAPDCQYRLCQSNSCGTGNDSSSTPAPMSYQTAGDCKTVVCNGSGGVNGTVPENADLPDDNNECTSNLCTNGTPTFPPVSDGTLCPSDAMFCTGVEACQGGTCTSPGDPCGSASDSDCAACNEGSDDCSADEPYGSPCDDGTYCNGTDTCNANGSCADYSGDPCAPYTDPDCAGGCSESNEACTADEPDGSPCQGGICLSGVCQ